MDESVTVAVMVAVPTLLNVKVGIAVVSSVMETTEASELSHKILLVPDNVMPETPNWLLLP